MKKERSSKARRLTLIYTTAIALLAVFSAAISTFAWFQANASATVNTESDSVDITVAAPDAVKFYYFKGNGVPGSTEYTGYSKSGATYGNTTNTVNTSNGTFSTSGLTDVSISTFANAWERIDIESVSTSSGVASGKNCFNFSRMRAGCYYSFCIETDLSSSKLNLAYRWDSTYGVTGNDISPKRFVYNGGTTVYPLNLLMTINGYCKELSTNNGTTYIKETLGVGSTLSLTDKIVFANNIGTGTTTSNYYLLGSAGAGANTSTNKYIYFTIFMGLPDKSDAMQYIQTTSSIQYYQRGVTTGVYSPVDGLKSTLSAVTVS